MLQAPPLGEPCPGSVFPSLSQLGCSVILHIDSVPLGPFLVRWHQVPNIYWFLVSTSQNCKTHTREGRGCSLSLASLL